MSTEEIVHTMRRTSVASAASRRSSTISLSHNANNVIDIERTEDDTKPDNGHVIRLPIDNQSIIIKAIQECNVVELQHIIKAIPIAERQDFVNQHDSEGNPQIFHAIYFQEASTDMLCLLLDYGANPNLQNNMKQTGIHLACQRNHRKAIKQLIIYDASVQVDNWEHLQPYQMISDVKEEQAVMQNYVNTCFEKYELDIEQKIIIKVSLIMRSYYRAVFDEMDLREKGYLDFIEIKMFLESLHPIGGIEPAPATTKDFFLTWDRSKTGKLKFPDFLHFVTLHEIEKEKQAKKLAKQQLLAKRKAARKAAAAAAKK